MLRRTWKKVKKDGQKKMSKFSERENKICDMLAWLACHADEDCPGEYRTKHFKNALDRAVEFLDSSGWYDFNKEARSKK